MAGGEENNDDLNENLRDRLVATGRAIVGTVPWAGGALGEILTAIIPGQRADRIVAYLRQLSERMMHFEAEMQASIAKSAGKIELIEEGGYQAGRALTDERIGQIVTAVTNGLESAEADIIRRKRLLLMLGQLDDDAVAVLDAFGRNYGDIDNDVWDSLNLPEPSHMQSPTEDIDREALYEAGRDQLIRLGLLEKKLEADRDNLPKFDRWSGDFKHRVEISYLGRMLLREIGKPIAFDLEQ